VGACRKLHNEELHDFYASHNIIRLIKSRKMRCVGNVARMGEMTHTHTHTHITLDVKREMKRALGKVRVDGRIILKWTLRK
jgi:hypothetical protein